MSLIWFHKCATHGCVPKFTLAYNKGLTKAACSVVVKLIDLDPQGRWFDPSCGPEKICSAVGPLSKALDPTLFQGVCILLSQINCKSLWIQASAKLCHVKKYAHSSIHWQDNKFSLVSLKKVLLRTESNK